MSKITVPPETIEAAAIDLYRALHPEPDYHSWADTPEWMRELMRRHARAACLAMLRAWPRAYSVDNRRIILPLPLPQENQNDKA